MSWVGREESEHGDGSDGSNPFPPITILLSVFHLRRLVLPGRLIRLVGKYHIVNASAAIK